MNCESCGDYIKERKISEGTYGEIYVVHPIDRTNYILKQFFQSATYGIYHSTVIEMDILNRVSHPNVISAHEMSVDIAKKEICTILDYAEMDLHQYIKQNKEDPSIPSEKAMSIIQQLLCGLHYLHSNYIVHRDIKPENILMFTAPLGTGKIGDFTPKIADFGLAHLGDTENIRYNNLVYSAWYRPPEIFAYESAKSGKYFYNSRADVYALGLVFFEILMGQPLIYGKTDLEMVTNILKRIGPIPEYLRTLLETGTLGLTKSDYIISLKSSTQSQHFKNMKPDLRKFILSMVTTDPKMRLSASESSLMFKKVSAFQEKQCEIKKIGYQENPVSSLSNRRDILEWIFEIAKKYKMTLEMWLTFVDIFDRYVSVAGDSDLAMVALSCLRLATKLHESDEFYLHDQIKALQGYTKLNLSGNEVKNDFLSTELLIMRDLEFKLYQPTLNLLLPKANHTDLIECTLDYSVLTDIKKCLSERNP